MVWNILIAPWISSRNLHDHYYSSFLLMFPPPFSFRWYLTLPWYRETVGSPRISSRNKAAIVIPASADASTAFSFCWNFTLPWYRETVGSPPAFLPAIARHYYSSFRWCFHRLWLFVTSNYQTWYRQTVGSPVFSSRDSAAIVIPWTGYASATFLTLSCFNVAGIRFALRGNILRGRTFPNKT